MLANETGTAIIGGIAVIIAAVITSGFKMDIATIVFIAITIVFVAIIIWTLRKLKVLEKNTHVSVERIEIKTRIHFVRELSLVLSYVAQKEIIIIGGPSTQLTWCQELMCSTTKLKIRLLALNIEKPEIADIFYKDPPHISITDNLNHLRAYKEYNQIEVRVYESFPLAYFFGIDINDPQNGLIIVAHRLSGISENEYPNMRIDRSYPELYEYYRKYIETFWNNSEKLDARK